MSSAPDLQPAARALSVGARVVLLTLLIGLTLIGVSIVVLSSPRSARAQTVGDWTILAAALGAVWGCVSAARRGGPSARGWAVLAVAAAVWTAAQGVWTTYGFFRAHVYPFPSAADFGFIGYSLPATAALLLFPRSSIRQTSRLREILDASLIAASVLFVSWETVLGPLYEADGSGFSRLIGLGYPVADIAVASMVLVLGMRVSPGQRRSWLLLGGGLVLLAVTDSTYVSKTLAGEVGTTGTFLALGWIGAFLLVAAASQIRTEQDEVVTLRHFTVLQELLPFLPMGAAVVVAACLGVNDGGPFLIGSGLLVLVLAAAQRVVSAMDKVRLANDLEAVIELRTMQLTSADARFRALVQSSDDAIFSKTPEGLITSWNPAAERLFGFTFSEIVGQSVDVIVPIDRQDEEQEIRRTVGNGSSFRRSYETTRRRRDGSVFPIALTISPMYEGGEISGISVIARDITEARERERELAAARTVAVDASRAKTDFLATMSHEIRTPMNGVIGLTRLLLRTNLDESQRRYACGVRGAGEALLGIIDDILDFSKLEAGKVELESVDFDPRELVEEVGVLLAEAAASKDLELIAYCDPAVPAALNGDPGRIRQILINLAANAVKFTAAGEVVIRVTATLPPDARPGDDASVIFEVTDTGIGISDGTQARLFEPFSQADASTTRRFGGTGLGLAICRRLVNAMGGDIEVSSEINVGSTFRVTLTLPVRPALASLQIHPEMLRGLRVLVVDDNATNRFILAQQLLDWHMVAEVSVDAGAALVALSQAVAQGAPYDFALLDLCMPGMDGLELASAVAADPTLMTTRCMILSSSGSVDTVRATAAGVQEWISKPIRLSELHDSLTRMIGQTPNRSRLKVPASRDRESLQGAGRILVVEDNLVNQMVAQGVLVDLGYQVELAANGRESLAAIEANRFDAVLMDCHMPEMDGFEATRLLREREGSSGRIPVIAMTAGVLAEDRKRCRTAGMDDFVAKPIDVEHLKRTLAKWIKTPIGVPPKAAVPPDPTIAPESAVVSLPRLDLLRSLGPADGWGLLPQIVTAFLKASDAQRDELHAAAEAHDHEGVSRAAHRLRGAAANLGAEPLADACAEVERLAAMSSSDLRQGVDQIDDRLSATCSELESVLAGRA
ncbi:MAG TPA: response regulator [Kineosporiaceae bacterium]|nr:response regulator [Kineosporiaceae bacterium]